MTTSTAPSEKTPVLPRSGRPLTRQDILTMQRDLRRAIEVREERNTLRSFIIDLKDAEGTPADIVAKCKKILSDTL